MWTKRWGVEDGSKVSGVYSNTGTHAYAFNFPPYAGATRCRCLLLLSSFFSALPWRPASMHACITISFERGVYLTVSPRGQTPDLHGTPPSPTFSSSQFSSLLSCPTCITLALLFSFDGCHSFSMSLYFCFLWPRVPRERVFE